MEYINELNELCYILYKRYLLNLKRHRARYKKSYYSKILLALKEKRLKSTSKYHKLGINHIKAQILRYEGINSTLKSKILQHTLSSRSRISVLKKIVNGSILYYNGEPSLYVKGKTLGIFFRDSLKERAIQHQALLSIQKMLAPNEDSL